MSRRERIGAGGEPTVFPYDAENERAFRSISNETLSLTMEKLNDDFETWTTRRDFALIAVGVFGVVGVVLRVARK